MDAGPQEPFAGRQEEATDEAYRPQGRQSHERLWERVEERSEEGREEQGYGWEGQGEEGQGSGEGGRDGRVGLQLFCL